METTFSFDISTVLTLGFYTLAIVYVIFSVVFYYHWSEYAVDKKITNLSLLLYFCSTLPLIAIMGLVLFLS